jgi:hypothetical protein
MKTEDLLSCKDRYYLFDKNTYFRTRSLDSQPFKVEHVMSQAISL